MGLGSEADGVEAFGNFLSLSSCSFEAEEALSVAFH